MLSSEAVDATVHNQSNMSKLEKVQKEILKYDYIRFSLCDMNGQYRGQVICSRHASEYLTEGLDLNEGILVMGPRTEVVFIKEEQCYTFGNMLIIPDLDTMRPIPWSPDGAKVAEFLCESQWKKDDSPQEACPRFTARRQIQRLDDLGFKIYSAFEVEFALYDRSTMKPLFDGYDVYSQRSNNTASKVLFEFEKMLTESYIDVQRFHCEYGPGMCEVITQPRLGIESPDMTMNLKESLMEMADDKGLLVTFMSKIREDPMVGIGTHFNFSIWNKSTNENVLYDSNAPDNLSIFAKHWLAGVLKHSKALCAFTNPTVNCYRRLHQQFFPFVVCWGIEDREAGFRVKNRGPKGTYIENRQPSGKSNAYLVVAATIAAGLDGVEKKLECPPQGKGDNSEILPKSLSEALDELEKDTDLVSVLGAEFVRWFVKCKRDGEIEKYKDIENDDERFEKEREKYFI